MSDPWTSADNWNEGRGGGGEGAGRRREGKKKTLTKLGRGFMKPSNQRREFYSDFFFFGKV